MNVLLLQDVYKLGRAGQVKKVTSGYGRNFLIPQGMALPATKAAISQAERITAKADKERSVLNTEMSAVAEKVKAVQLLFPAHAGETGKLYGSVTTQMIADQLAEKIGLKIDKRQVHSQPLRLLGMHKIGVRLTIDVIPHFDAVVYREGEDPKNYMIAAQELAAAAEAAQQAKLADAAKAEATVASNVANAKAAASGKVAEKEAEPAE